VPQAVDALTDVVVVLQEDFVPFESPSFPSPLGELSRLVRPDGVDTFVAVRLAPNDAIQEVPGVPVGVIPV
jgi:hypothetical protein